MGRDSKERYICRMDEDGSTICNWTGWVSFELLLNNLFSSYHFILMDLSYKGGGVGKR